MADKYLGVDATTGRLKQNDATTTSSGAGQAGKIVALDSAGKLDASLIPSGAGDADVINLTATEALTIGDWVNIYNNSGTPAARKALATDTTKPAHGFVIAGVGAGVAGNIYLGGSNNKIPIASFTATDIGKEMFLSAVTGGLGVTAPNTTSSGYLLQRLGKVITLDASCVTVKMDLGDEIIL